MTSISDFAPELLHRVFRLCSQSDLVSLSRVNYTFGEAADYLLHRDIRISCNFLQRFGPQLRAKTSLFRCTLTSNPQKAAFLRSLHVGLMSGNTKDQESYNYHMLTQIADALRNTHGLEDLRIILSEVIKGGYFQLHTLYCDSYQDLEGIIVSQKHLRLLGTMVSIPTTIVLVIAMFQNFSTTVKSTATVIFQEFSWPPTMNSPTTLINGYCFLNSVFLDKPLRYAET
ncbi:hypothetical protein M378DRAFT_568176 [Amanita muscaria Koide BX008]|uniref:F-box domain-containing protein n=1 Tax=Amanita muscaria (strain Koide BX008) TaxID=946122 RepID=A0A0C2X812_AMAMK|nr:hypothetical protein M378DRAFT_568176 [Amanita muscaria Koide BX008]